VRRASACLAAAALVAACGAPARPVDLARGDTLRAHGDDPAALDAYTRATETCKHIGNHQRRGRFCAMAWSARAETLERLGRDGDAADAWEQGSAAIAADAPIEAARALHEAALLRLHLGQDARAYDLFWKVILNWPDETPAEDALRVVVRDGRRRDPKTLDRVLGELYERLGDTEIADNLLYARADLRLHELGDPQGALDLLDRLVERYPKAALYDDALWEGANLARTLKDPKGAVRRLRQLLATRERAFIVGSYHSIWLDDAQLLVGVILRDDLADPRAALPELERLPDDYPDSTLRDDALWEVAVTRAQLGDTAGACAALAKLARRYPDSKHLLDDAPAKSAALGCKVEAPGAP
jgi:tetratricopeptide (TPR) repeat protein